MNHKFPLPRGPVPLLNGLRGVESGNIFDGRCLREMYEKGYGIQDSLGRYNVELNHTITIQTTGFFFKKAMDAFIIIANTFCGDALSGILEPRQLKYEGLREAATEAARDPKIHDFLVFVTKTVFDVVEEYDCAARAWNINEASVHLYTRMIGKNRLADLIRYTIDLLECGDGGKISMNHMQLNVEVGFGYFHQNGYSDVSFLLDKAVDVVERLESEGQLRFTRLLMETRKIRNRSPIPADAIAAVALAKVGLLLQCEPPSREVMQHIAGQDHRPFKGWALLTRPAASWLTPFKSYTPDRRVLAFDCNTWLRPQNTDTWTAPRFTSCIQTPVLAGSPPPLTIPPPYVHIDVAGLRAFQTMLFFIRPAAQWNDGLEENIRELEMKGFPLGGVEASCATRTARDRFTSSVSWKREYTECVLSTPRTIAAYLEAKHTGASLRDVIYQYVMWMFHPYVTKMYDRPLFMYLIGMCDARAYEQSYIEELQKFYGDYLPDLAASADVAIE